MHTHACMHTRRKQCEEGMFYLEEHVLLTGCQVHLILIVIDTDVDNVCQQLLIARDHFQLLVKTLNNSATHWSGRANIFLYHPEGPELGRIKKLGQLMFQEEGAFLPAGADT